MIFFLYLLMQHKMKYKISEKEIVGEWIKYEWNADYYKFVLSLSKEPGRITVVDVQKYGCILRYHDPKLYKYNELKDLYMAAVTQYGYAIDYVRTDLLKDIDMKEIYRAAVNTDGRTIKCAIPNYINHKNTNYYVSRQ